MKKCKNCPELLTEDYGVAKDTCANCQAEENDICLKIAHVLRDTAGDLNQSDRAKKILKEIENINSVTRFEVIDHRTGVSNTGRAFVAKGCKIGLSFQDRLKTLKVFVNDKK
jgi:hypothetical protein